ncbi:MAG: M20/M25/M40 family metallo-hydrolase, partial [Gemmatimonadales bacterium]
PGPVRVRLKVTGERGPAGMHEIWNTFGLLRGERFPDEWVIAGAHRDAWTPGAEDNVSGTVGVLEAARALAALAREGIRPARSILFATWDAEEWGLIGSIEWVEEMEDSLLAHAVAYINEDGAVAGSQFGGAGSPSLKPLFRDAARAVPAPRDAGSVYDAWWRSRGRDTTRLTLGNLGGGSDFQGFSHHLGIPSGGVGFDGPSGIYHSMYDSYHWMSRFGDPGYRSHRALAALVGVILSRLANAEIVPLDYAAWGRDMHRMVAGLDSAIAGRSWTVSTHRLRDALDRFTAAAVELSGARDAALAASPDATRATAANRALMQVERRLTRPEGLVSRPWYRSLQFASDLDRGYATMPFPSVGEAIRYADAAAVERELRDLTGRIDEARAALERATAALR